MMMPPRRSALLLLIAVFLAGGGIGLLVGRNLDASDRGRHPAGERGYLGRLTRHLELTPGQRDSVRVLLDRYQPGFDSIWADSRPRYETLRARVRSDIRAQLTPEQQLRYDSMTQRHDAERRRGER